MREHYREELLRISTARRGWFAFFVDTEDAASPLWGEIIEAWGTFFVQYVMHAGVNGAEVVEDEGVMETRAMRVEEGSGTLVNDFQEADNFLGVFYSRTLHHMAGHNTVTYEDICQDTKLLTRLQELAAAHQAEQSDLPDSTPAV